MFSEKELLKVSDKEISKVMAAMMLRAFPVEMLEILALVRKVRDGIAIKQLDLDFDAGLSDEEVYAFIFDGLKNLLFLDPSLLDDIMRVETEEQDELH